MPRTTISTDDAPAAIGPYSQAVCVTGGRTLFTSGQIPLDSKTGEMVGGDDVGAQAAKVMDNLLAVLTAADMGFEHVVKATIYLLDLEDFSAVNKVYAARFHGAPPARACVQVARLPKDARVEIDCIAVAEN
jgi:2-iminobutanoate/2-iminopropanoate deaminase